MTQPQTAVPSVEEFFLTSGMDADTLLKAYLSALYKREKSMLGVSKASGLDRRTVKKYLLS